MLFATMFERMIAPCEPMFEQMMPMPRGAVALMSTPFITTLLSTRPVTPLVCVSGYGSPPPSWIAIGLSRSRLSSMTPPHRSCRPLLAVILLYHCEWLPHLICLCKDCATIGSSMG